MSVYWSLSDKKCGQAGTQKFIAQNYFNYPMPNHISPQFQTHRTATKCPLFCKINFEKGPLKDKTWACRYKDSSIRCFEFILCPQNLLLLLYNDCRHCRRIGLPWPKLLHNFVSQVCKLTLNHIGFVEGWDSVSQQPPCRDGTSQS